MDGRTSRRWGAHALLGIAAALVVAVAVYPRLGTLLPACPIREYLGFLCPGCGGTRAMVALLRGHIGEAVRLNALFVALLPFGIWFGAESYRRAVRQREFAWPQVPAVVAYVIALAGVVFAVFRNVAI